eukprot:TRINITY_DN318_c0_g1_i1.p1 TRINITY_DN318_c0_g1~~TRINITY_DN318_c0_g1_i1.p1  ORF type:complete len:419 (+),score=43.41 TRINITY_DN318_c0_g1_i1:67-1323(+)
MLCGTKLPPCYKSRVYFTRPSSTKFRPVVKARRLQIVQDAIQSPTASNVQIDKEEVILSNDINNVTESIYDKIGINLHQQENHPLCIIKDAIYSYFDDNYAGQFDKFDDLYPIVTTKANFDDVLVPEDHVSRRPNDTYYVDQQRVLRCHTSAHQAEMIRNGESKFLITGDVYRRDDIDPTHYPVFHQMEGVRVFDEADLVSNNGSSPQEYVMTDLKQVLEGLAKRLFGDVECRWVDAYFPFTNPSAELEIYFNDEWLEVLGCGVMEQQILDDNGMPGKRAWAFGLGLERWAMILFDIPDIRLFWSNDERFLSQFKSGVMTTKFKSFSKYPPVYKDIAFWISDKYTPNNFSELVREVAGDLVEKVELIDDFTHPKKQRTSHCYRITYRSMERSLTDDEINAMQTKVRENVANKLMVELR